MTWTDPAGAPAGGNCYNCHQIEQGRDLVRHDRAEPLQLRQAARRQGPGRSGVGADRPVHLGQDLQRQGVQRLLRDAALRPRRGAVRAADPGPDGAAARPGVAGQPVAVTSVRVSLARGATSCSCWPPRRRPAWRSTAAACSPPRPARPSALYELPRLRQRQLAALHRLPRAAAAGALPRAERQHRRRRGGGQAAASGRRAAAAGSSASRRGTRARARVHAPRFRAGRAHATARSAASRTSRRWSSGCARSRPARCCSTAATPGRARRPRCGRSGQDMIDAAQAARRRHHDRRTGSSPTARSASRRSSRSDFKGRIEFLAQNVRTADFGDPVFPPYVLREVNGVPVAIIGQAFPYTPIANPRHFVPDWTFGIQEENLQKTVDEVRAQGRAGRRAAVAQRHGRRPEARVARERHRRDPRRPHARRRAGAVGRAATRGGKTLVTNAGSQRQVPRACSISTCATARCSDFRYRLLPVFANLLPADRRDAGADRQACARRTQAQAGREARRHRRPALPARQLQRHASTS